MSAPFLLEQSEVKPSRIFRKGLFLWQEDTPSGAGLNLWSGLLSPNNGYPEAHALKAAMLFEAAPDLLAALQDLIGWIPNEAAMARMGFHTDAPVNAHKKAQAAIRKATLGSAS